MSTMSWLEGFRGTESWRTLLASRGPVMAAGILALALAAQAAVIVTDLAGAGAPPPASLTEPWRPHANGVHVAAIVNSHLFGRAPPTAGPTGADAPRTALPLVLTGVIAAADPHTGMAILGPSAQTAKVYAVGDSIPGGAQLNAVLPRKVLLKRNGQLESLVLPRQALGAPPPSRPHLGASQKAAPRFAARMRELVARRPGIVADLLRPEPVFSHGKQLGYRVYPGKDPRAFKQLGLKAGDLVTAIDGTPLNDPAQDQQILGTLGSSSQATVTVLRDGRHRTLTLNLAQVEQAAQSLTSPHSGKATPAGATRHPRRFWSGQHPHSSKPGSK